MRQRFPIEFNIVLDCVFVLLHFEVLKRAEVGLLCEATWRLCNSGIEGNTWI